MLGTPAFVMPLGTGSSVPTATCGFIREQGTSATWAALERIRQAEDARQKLPLCFSLLRIRKGLSLQWAAEEQIHAPFSTVCFSEEQSKGRYL